MKNLSQISVILMKNLSHFGHLRLAGMFRHIDFENPNFLVLVIILFLKITSNLTGVGLYRRPSNVS